MLKKLLAAGVLAAALSGGAQAATVSYTSTIGEADTDWSGTLSVAKFDAALGNLTKVTFNYGGLLWSALEVENRSTESGTEVTAHMVGAIVFGLPIGEIVDLTLENAFAVSLAAFDGAIDFAGSSGHAFAPRTNENYDTKTFTSLLSMFQGPGTLDITADASGSVLLSGGGNVLSGIETRASAWLEVVYEYSTDTSVPEPAPLALLGAGLLGLGIARRKRG